jgi:5-formyltetrahydrofolate cyclo-ligase
MQKPRKVPLEFVTDSVAPRVEFVFAFYEFFPQRIFFVRPHRTERIFHGENISALFFFCKVNYHPLMTKNDLRTLMKEKFSALNFSAEQKNLASQKMQELFLQKICIDEFDAVLSYADTKNEISPRAITEISMQKNKVVALPKVVRGTSRMNFFILKNSIPLPEQIQKGAFGIYEPAGGEIFCAENFAGKKILVVVPGVAFSKKCGRLGHGMGFYDAYISHLKSVCEKNGAQIFLAGVAFSFQILEQIVCERHDHKTDCVVCENYFFASAE